MKYIGHVLQKNITPKHGVLLVNLGTPSAPTTQALRQYLAEFLADPRVIEIPRWRWLPILYGVILPFRSYYSAKLYKKIWSEQGSPLLVNSKNLADKLQITLAQLQADNIKVTLAMRYNKPSIRSGLEQLRQANVNRLIVLPLYPQYSSAATGSTFDGVTKILRQWRWVPELHFISNYSLNHYYIDAITQSIIDHWAKNERGEKLLFSFHGIPQSKANEGDPYYLYCRQTTELIADKLQLTKDSWQLVFQSRFGREPWLQPYLDKTLITFAKQGIKKVDVICPGFAVDCLETLEEISERNQEAFIHAGGKQLNYIPALNDSPSHINALTEIILSRMQPY